MASKGIVAVGDSITNACSVDLIVDRISPRSWAQCVSAATGEPLTVHAKSGAPASEIRAMLPEMIESYSLALIYVGTNNVLSWRHWRREDLASEMHAILNIMRACSDRVAVMQLPDTLGQSGAIFPYGPLLKRRVRKAQKIVREAAASMGATLVTPPSLTCDRIWIDGVHPTSAGHRALADETVHALGLPEVPAARAEPRPDYASWRRRARTRFILTQPIRGVGGWVLGR
ncbi:GDSL-type esterase/lipase family protein [Cryobacterium sp. Y11]|uniref:SGNH/GDSL hydrolase family protein n=1 Tax=Cryobacterium sp. Y11 TaxID=2045016 RepID=UPI000CE45AD7